MASIKKGINNQLFIDSSGNVGIGTTSPVQKLQVDGSIYSNGGNVYINGDKSFVAVGNMKFETWDGSAYGERLRITAAGNVGIGTTAPISALHILGNQFRIEDNDPTITLKRNVASAFGGHIDWLTNDNTLGFQIANNALVSAAALEFNHSGVNRMVIKSDGNVGIGTTSPAYKLDVNGETRLGKLITTWSNSPITPSAVMYSETGYNTVIAGNGQFSTSYLALMTTGNMIYSGGNVGIGTTSPSYKLDVRASAAGNYAYFGASSDGGQRGLVFTSADNGVFLGAIHTINASSGSGIIALATGGNERMRITDTGNVGIGTTSPSTKLHIVQSGTAVSSDGVSSLVVQKSAAPTTAAAINIVSGDSAEASIRFGDTTDQSMGALRYLNDVDAFSIVTNNNEQVRITSAGNVGIGTTTPTRSLSVAGGIIRVQSGTSSTTGQIDFGNADTYFGYYNNVFQARTWDGFDYYEAFRINGANHNLILSTSEGNVGIGTTAPTTKLHVTGVTQIAESGNIAFYGGNYVRVFNDQNFNIRNVSGTTVANISVSGNSYFNGGNVGIGTTSPSDTLDLYQAANTTAIRLTSAGVGSKIYRLTSQLIGVSNAGFGIQNATDGRYELAIDGSGNVGIGTTSPTHGALEVYRNGVRSVIAIHEDAGTAEARLHLRRGGNDTYIQTDGSGFNIRTEGNLSSGNAPLAIDSTGNVTLGYDLIATGNVGIGTTSPSAKLHIYGGGNTIFEGPANTDIDIRYRSDGANKYNMFYQASTDGWGLYYNPSTAYRLFVNSSGNVGIGTNSPAQKLHVAGASIVANSTSIDPDAYVDQMVAGLIQDGSGWSAKGFGGNAGTGDSWAIAHNGGGIYFGIGNGTAANSMATYMQVSPSRDVTFNDQVRITSGGNVGIGTTAPTVPLHIVKDNATISMTNTTAFAVDTGSRLFLGGKYSSATSNNTIPFAWIVGAKENATDGNQAGYLSITTTANGGGFAERMRVTSAGNVGIGTTTPPIKLYVGTVSTGTNGNGTYASDAIAVNSSESITIGPDRRADWGLNPTTATSTTFQSKLNIWSDNEDHITFGGASTHLVSAWESFKIWINNDSASAGTLHLYHTSSKTEFVRLAGSGNSWINGGNVGIGTTQPIYKLHVEGSVGAGHVTMQVRNASTTAGSSASIRLYSSGVGNMPVLISNIPDATGGTLVFNQRRAGNTYHDTVVFKGDGNVGIGTDNPSEKLDVVGNIKAQYNGNNYSRIGQNSSGGYLQAYSGAVERIMLRSYGDSFINGGNVGIGTTSPTSPLTVTTATNAVDVVRLNNTGGDSGSVQGVTHLAINHFNAGTNPSTRITAYQDSTSGWPGGMYFSTRSLNTDSAPLERMRITSGGNVGIGTTSPQHALVVNGDAQINASGTGPSYAYVPGGEFGVDNLLTSSTENVALGKPDVWLRIHVDGVAFVFPGYQEP